MGILTGNPIARYEVEQDWNCWPWTWFNDKSETVDIANRFMDALGADWEFWSDELWFIATARQYSRYCTEEQIARLDAGVERLIEILYSITGRAGQIHAHSNPMGGYRMSPEFQIHIGNVLTNETNSFLFRVNDTRRVAVADILEGFNHNETKNNLFLTSIRWDENGKSIIKR